MGSLRHRSRDYQCASFFENVPKHRFEKRELRPDEKPESVVLHFEPQPLTDMFIACLWSKWQEPGQPDLYSFAANTDDPPPRSQQRGHDRCIVSIKPENVDAWLAPQGKAERQSILDQSISRR